jgi:integrase/recombinase XerD
LFLTGYGEAFNPDVVSRMVAGLIRKVTGCVASCHLLRHTCAAHMLEGGADIRYIQQLLGHEKLETTAIYTEVSIKQLQEVHTRCHPSARLPEPEIPACNPPPTS